MIKDLTQDKNMYVHWLSLIYNKLVEISKQPNGTTDSTYLYDLVMTVLQMAPVKPATSKFINDFTDMIYKERKPAETIAKMLVNKVDYMRHFDTDKFKKPGQIVKTKSLTKEQRAEIDRAEAQNRTERVDLFAGTF